MTRDALEIACRDANNQELGRFTWCTCSCSFWFIHGNRGFRVCPFDVRDLLDAGMTEFTEDQVLRVEISLMPNDLGLPRLEIGESALSLNYFFPQHQLIGLRASLDEDYTPRRLRMFGDADLLHTLLEIYPQHQAIRLQEENLSFSRMIVNGNRGLLNNFLESYPQPQAINNGVNIRMRLFVSAMEGSFCRFSYISDAEGNLQAEWPVHLHDIKIEGGDGNMNIVYGGAGFIVRRQFSIYTAFPLLVAAYFSRDSSGTLLYVTHVKIPLEDGIPIYIQYTIV